MNDVRDEALGALLERAAVGIESVSVDRLPYVLRRGSRRHTARFTAIGAAVTVFVGAISWGGLSIRGDGTIPANIADWRTFASLEENGWTIQVPPPWRVQALPSCPNAHERIGVIVTNTDFEFLNPRGESPQCEDRFVFQGFPRDGVAFAFMPRGILPGAFTPPADSALPLTPDLLIVSGGIRGGPAESFQSIAVGNGWLGMLRRWVGPDATASAVGALDRMLGSFRVKGAARWVSSDVGGHGSVVHLSHPDYWSVSPATEIAAMDAPQPLVRLASPEVRGNFCLGIPWGRFGSLGDYGVAVLISDASAAWGPADVGPRPTTLRPSTAVEDHVVRCGQDIRVLRFLYKESGRRIQVDVALSKGVMREGPQQLWHILNSIRVSKA